MDLFKLLDLIQKLKAELHEDTVEEEDITRYFSPLFRVPYRKRPLHDHEAQHHQN